MYSMLTAILSLSLPLSPFRPALRRVLAGVQPQPPWEGRRSRALPQRTTMTCTTRLYN